LYSLAIALFSSSISISVMADVQYSKSKNNY
jgi:hypothetical protein